MAKSTNAVPPAFLGRECPSHVLDGLREITINAHFLYLGSGRWLLCTLESENAIRRQQAYSMMERLTAELRNGSRLPMPAIRQRAAFANLMARGFVAIDTYDIQGAPTFAIVEDYRRAVWLAAHTTDDELFEQIEQRNAAAQMAARNDITDPARHRAAWRYAFTRSHAVTRRDQTTANSVKAGRIRHPIHSTPTA